MRRIRRHVTLLTLALISGGTHAQIVASIEQADGGASGDVLLVLKYTNTGHQPASIREADIPRTMPDGRLWNNAFQVLSSTGSLAAYRGVIVNLAPEARTARVTLEPGQETIVNVNLSRNYALQSSTTYDVTPRGFEQRQGSLDRPQDAGVDSDDTVIYTQSPSIRVQTGTGVQRGAISASMSPPFPRVSCEPEKVTAVTEAMPIAAKLARDAHEYVEALYEITLGPDGSHLTFKQTARYTTWFGAHGDPNKLDPINTRIRTVLSSTANRFGMFSPPSCDCPEPAASRTIAWVDPDSAHVINYCPKFFKLPLGPNVETGSRARTIYHEATHFNDFLAKGAEDYEAYFALPEEARRLALDARDVASNHAYSFEYFADNLDSQN